MPVLENAWIHCECTYQTRIIMHMKRKKIPLTELQAVIFDIDGVLVDTEYFQWQAWIEVLKPFGKTISIKEYFKYAGKRGDIVESEIIKDLALKSKKYDLLIKKEKLLIEWFHKKPVARMPRVQYALRYFTGKGLKLAVASGSPKVEAMIKLKSAKLLPFFQSIVSGNDVIRGKPFPDIYLAAAEALGVAASNCLAFEDTQYGVESAKSAGLFCFAVPHMYSKEQDFTSSDGVFGNLQEAVLSLQ